MTAALTERNSTSPALGGAATEDESFLCLTKFAQRRVSLKGISG